MLTGFYGLYATLGPNLRFGYATSPAEIALLDQEDNDRFSAALNEAIRLHPKSAGLFYLRAAMYEKMHDRDRAIADYSEAIRLDPEYVYSFNDRGYAYAAKRDCDRAIADYNEVIRHDPGNVYAFNNRGRAYAAKQDYDRAIADFTEAIRLDPKYVYAFDNRGRAYAAKQDYDRAIADFTEAIRLDPKSPYAVLWLYIERKRSGTRTAAAELGTNAKNLKQPDWPYSVVELFLGRLTADATLAAATKPDERCEAQFYVGEWHLLRGDRAAATAALKTAVDSCPKTFDTVMEYEFARAELQRLRP